MYAEALCGVLPSSTPRRRTPEVFPSPLQLMTFGPRPNRHLVKHWEVVCAARCGFYRCMTFLTLPSLFTNVKVETCDLSLQCFYSAF